MINFLNCNYPNKCKIPKGKPKIKQEQLKLECNGISLIAEKDNKIWIDTGKNYWIGIEFEIIKDIFNKVDIFTTIGKINLALMDWIGEPLNNEQVHIIDLYLRTII